tara:strand:+ start:580 stop:2019 length:1440 start_codon:yes stop_codon:yes gene_type:complete
MSYLKITKNKTTRPKVEKGYKMKYSKMKTTELRKLLSERLRNGTIETEGQRPTNPSKVFRLTNKETAVRWLTSNCITWGEYNDDGSIFSEDSKGGGEGSGNNETKDTKGEDDATSETGESTQSEGEDGTQSEDGEQSAPEDQVKGELNKMFNDSNGGHQFVTTSGTLTAQEVDDSLQINQRLNRLADFTGYALHKIHKMSKTVKTTKGSSGGKVVINLNNKEIKRTDKVHYHPKFEKLTNYALWHKNVMLVGEAGTGKTTVAEQVAKSLDLSFRHLSCSAGMSEAHLLGRMVFDGSYVQSDFVEIYENGGVFLFDEFDAMDGNCAVVINSALANGKMSVPNRKENPTAIRHEDCIIIVACNTFGTGYGDRVYAGRNKLDGATLDRFCSSKIYFTYDKSLEDLLGGNWENLKKALWKLRNEVGNYKLDKVISTRLFYNGNIALTNGETPKDFMETATLGWTKEELAKVDIDGIIKIAEGK